ncbi:hypothetical protein F0U59_21285 [Archangium gephyra]|nr:hypothetical protein F0U59_21285 [Archangium gephyra]
MPINPIRSSLCTLLTGLVLAACGPVPESPEGLEALGVAEAAMCSSSAVTSLTLSGISTYQGEMAGAGTYAVSYPANAVWLVFSIDGVEQSQSRVDGGTGTWSFSKAPVSCGTHTFTVTARPMVVSSNGTWSICSGNSGKTITQSVTEPCPAGKKCLIEAHSWECGAWCQAGCMDNYSYYFTTACNSIADCAGQESHSSGSNDYRPGGGICDYTYDQVPVACDYP